MRNRNHRSRTGFRLHFERLTQRKLFAGDLATDTCADEPTTTTPAEVGSATAGEDATAGADEDLVLGTYVIGGIEYHDPDGIGHCNPNYGSGYYVTIYVDQPGVGGDADPVEGSDTGHVWIEVGYEGGDPSSGGLYPGPDLRDDTENGHAYDVYLTLPISQEQYEAMVEQLEQDEQNPPPWTFSYHCANYALDFLEEHTDYEIESEPIPYPVGTGTGLSPGTVGEDIVEDYGGTYSPGSTAGGGP